MPELAGQELIGLASTPGSANGDTDIEKIRQEAIAAAQADFNERAKGFQRLIAERETALKDAQRQLEESRLSSLPDDERELEVQKRSDQEIDRLRAENELLRLMPDYPDELPVFQRLLAAPDAKTQLELLRELRGGTKAAAITPASGTAPAAVDPNNPVTDTPGGGVYEGAPMTAELAERLLNSVSRLRG